MHGVVPALLTWKAQPREGRCSAARAKRFSTTHVGSLPRPNGTDRPGGEDDAELRRMVADVVTRQRAIGIDIVNEGEYTKGGDWLSFVEDRFPGFEERPPAGERPLIVRGKEEKNSPTSTTLPPSAARSSTRRADSYPRAPTGCAPVRGVIQGRPSSGARSRCSEATQAGHGCAS